MDNSQQQIEDSAPNEENSQLKLCFGIACLSGDAILSVDATDWMEGRHIAKSITAVVVPPDSFRWNYQAETFCSKDGETIHRGFCVKSDVEMDGSVEMYLRGYEWELDQVIISGFEPFGMSLEEQLYWLAQIEGMLRGAIVPNLTLNKELRPFLYAVPLRGLSVEGEVKSFIAGDFGITSGEDDNILGPVIDSTRTGQEETAWDVGAPKAWGVVFARDFLEAEGLALERAQFTADLINFALRAGISHFSTRYDAELLEWNAVHGRTTVALQPWLLILEEEERKGWIRTVPLVKSNAETDLEKGYSRISFFIDRFKDISSFGGYKDQTGIRELSERERKLYRGIQRSIRWMGIASNEESIGDQFIAVWIALEAILESVEYPRVFGGDRRKVRSQIEDAIDSVSLPKQSDELLGITQDMIKGRAFSGHWPVRKKLEIFANSFGIKLEPNDTKVVGDLQRMRSQALHSGQYDCPISRGELIQLQYLVERLVAAATVGGYEDIEDDETPKFSFGIVGPMGGARPLFIDDRCVPYTMRFRRNEEGQLEQEYLVEGKIHNRTKM